jgi:N-methylhydantoinase B
VSRVLDGRLMDGRVHSYMPDDEVVVGGDLPLHRAADVELDPIVHEVLRYSLWNINEEHGLTIQKVSGSGIAKYARDFNPCIMTEDAEYVYFGPYIAMHAGVQDLNVRWILEYLATNPGIDDGDMFLCNDPWIGATHQSDASMLCPVFWNEQVFCWVANTLHFADLGGVRPGGWSPSAEDVFAEPKPIPPLKIVERGVLRRDLENMWTRQSRVPELTALDLRALVAGNAFARSRIHTLLERYGAETVKGSMRKIIDDSERVFTERLMRIPDGRWQDRIYIENARPGDRRIYKGILTLTKTGDRLVFENAGSNPAVGVLNSTYSGWRSAILAVVASLLCSETLRAVGGALRKIEFRPSPGTLATADFPSAVSSGVIFASANALSLATACVDKMLSFGPDAARTIVCSGGIGHFPIDALSGRDQHGAYFSNAMLDFNASPTGAGLQRDGIPTATPFWATQTIAPNVEDNEQVMPILYLWRRERADSGGVGTFVGGASLELAFVPHGTSEIVHQIASCGVAVPSSTGIFGGHPAATNRFRFLRGSSIEEAWRRGEMPDSLDHLGKPPEWLEQKLADLHQHRNDVLEIAGAAGGGFGDPLERDPANVATDVELGYVSTAAAEQHFGLAFDANGGPDAEATSVRRSQRRTARLAQAQPPSRVAAPSAGPAGDERPVMAGVFLRGEGLERQLLCRSCRTPLGNGSESYKRYASTLEQPLTAANSCIEDPELWVDDPLVLRLFLCPGCGTLLEVEVARPEDPPIDDVVLA